MIDLSFRILMNIPAIQISSIDSICVLPIFGVLKMQKCEAYNVK